MDLLSRNGIHIPVIFTG